MTSEKREKEQVNRKLAVSALAVGLFLTGMGTAFATADREAPSTAEARAAWKASPS
ncbi:hypothetical protein ABZ869_02615 [Streptomyces sp. NPDC046928]|uniref:hypothetical protein n=1 Tax=Streptomyces sp. NPDC046928 TaxID=3155021 RepID=UPI0033E1472C